MKKKIERELLAQLDKKGLRKNIEQILIPSEDVIEMKKGKKVNTERKFFSWIYAYEDDNG